MLEANMINLNNSDPHFISYNSCKSQPLDLKNPIQLVDAICENFNLCPVTTLNKFDFNSEWNFDTKKGDHPLVTAFSISEDECKTQCQKNINCKMVVYIYIKLTQARVCRMYNFSKNANNTHKFNKKKRKLNTFFKIDFDMNNNTNATNRKSNAAFDFGGDDASYANRIEIGNTLGFLSIFFVLLNSFN